MGEKRFLSGSFGWVELATKDTAGAKKFYGELFGWTAEDDAGMSPAPFVYTSFKNKDRMAGGMVPLDKEMGDMPPCWNVYFAVEDCDRALNEGVTKGAKVLMPPMNVPEIGRFAVISDPQGAVFSIIKLVNPEPN